MKLVNAYTVKPSLIEEGDVMLFVVKAMVIGHDSEGKLLYRLYRCPWEGSAGDIPQGNLIPGQQAICEALFPSLATVGRPG